MVANFNKLRSKVVPIAFIFNHSINKTPIRETQKERNKKQRYLCLDKKSLKFSKKSDKNLKKRKN
jgi:hypothetical protein